MQDYTIKCGLSNSFHNKTNLTGNKAAFGSSFYPSLVTLDGLISHITSGKAWTQGYFKGASRRKQNFVCAQTLALDLDDKISVADALSQPFIRDYALLVHPSPSSSDDHPKTRVVFVLEAAISDVQTWEQLQRSLITQFEHLRPDAACKDAARLFFGSDKPGAHVNLSARLPIGAIRGDDNTAEEQRRDKARLVRPDDNTNAGRHTGRPLHDHTVGANHHVRTDEHTTAPQQRRDKARLVRPDDNTNAGRHTGRPLHDHTVGANHHVRTDEHTTAPQQRRDKARLVRMDDPTNPAGGHTVGANHASPLHNTEKRLSEDLVRDVETALGIRNAAVNSEGFVAEAIACPIKQHEHDHQSKAAYWHPGIRALHCFKCGQSYNTHQVAAALGIDVSSYYVRSSVWEMTQQHTVGADGIRPTQADTACHIPTPPQADKACLVPTPPQADKACLVPTPTHPHDAEVVLPPFRADIQVDVPYISDIDLDVLRQARGVVIKSPIGTGKTEAAVQLIRKLGEQTKNGLPLRVLALTHRQSLAEDLTRRLNESGYTFACYKTIEAHHLPFTPRLVLCYDSIWKLARMGKGLPHYDLIIIDEVEQFHQHLGGETMRGGAPERAYTILRQVVMQADHILCMDAHATEVSRQWLAGVLKQGRHNDAGRYTVGTRHAVSAQCDMARHNTDMARHAPTPQRPDTVIDGQVIDGQVVAIENVYRPPDGKGTLTLYQSRDAALRTAMTLIDLDEGTVVIPTNTRSMAKTLHWLISKAYGADAVRVVHGGNSNDPDTQHFITHINEEIGKYRVLIYSPSLGTGVDITAPVRGVIGIFTHQPIDPSDMHQMMGRCRVAQERHAWVEGCHTHLETDWWAIFQRHEQNALNTGLHCQFDRYGIMAVTSIQRAMLRLLSSLEAQRNQMMNLALPYFALLAKDQGYTLDFVEGEDQSMKKIIKQALIEIKAEEKALALSSAPITYEELEQHQIKGTVTPEIMAGHERFKIEDCVGEDINSTLYDDLHTSTQRERLRRFSDLFEPEEELCDADQDEGRKDVLLSKRKHRAKKRRLILGALKAVWRDAISLEEVLLLATEQQLTEAEIEARLRPYFDMHRQEIIAYLKWRPDQSIRATALLRWLLMQIGLHLLSDQKMDTGERFRVYWVSQDSATKMIVYARSRLKHLQAKRAERDNLRALVGQTVVPRSHYSNRVYNTTPARSVQSAEEALRRARMGKIAALLHGVGV